MSERLYEIMNKLNPVLKKQNENFKPQDVRNMKQRMDTDSLERIDQPHEFKKAFQVWFDALGFDPTENPISRAEVLRDVGQVLDDLNYK